MFKTRFVVYPEVFRALRACGSVAVPERLYLSFMDYCNGFGCYPVAGAVVGSSWGDIRYIYLSL